MGRGPCCLSAREGDRPKAAEVQEFGAESRGRAAGRGRVGALGGTGLTLGHCVRGRPLVPPLFVSPFNLQRVPGNEYSSDRARTESARAD